MQALVGSTDGKLVAIDGKTMRRSFDRARGRSALHVVSAWVAANGVSLGQVVTDAKSNEITAIPALLDLLDIKGAVVSIDAMGCQKSIATKIVDCGADYLLALKDNHPTAHEEVAAYFTEAVGTPTVHSYASTDGGHGRVEVRTVHVTTDIGWFADRAEWKGLESFVMVESERDLGTKVQRDRRYFLCSLATTDAAAVGAYVRDHWSIENPLHWTLDVTFREDDCRIRDGHGPENFALLRKLAVVLLKRTPFGRRSLTQRQKLADRNPEYLASVLASGAP
jgi:predicted transposase YbfD/YdcC